MERHKDLTLCRGDNTTHVRMDAVNANTMKHYFDLLKKTLQENKLMDSPGQIYNVDKCGIPLDPKVPNVVAKVGSKKVLLARRGR